MASVSVYSILENKRVYNLSQAILAPNGTRNLKKRLTPCFDFKDGREYVVLEVGCGTGFFSVNRNNVHYTGIDVNEKYFPATPSAHMTYRAMNATRLDFPNDRFDLVYSVGVYHHLSDAEFRSSLLESARVLKPGGTLILLDNILPSLKINLYAFLIRKLDRGRFVRRKEEILEMLKAMAFNIVSQETFYYTVTGLEGIIVKLRKNAGREI